MSHHVMSWIIQQRLHNNKYMVEDEDEKDETGRKRRQRKRDRGRND